MEEIKDKLATEQTATPAYGSIGALFQNTRDNATRVITIVARDLDHVLPNGVRVAVWWTENKTTKRTTKLRDDTLGDDFEPVKLVKIEPPQSPPKTVPPSKKPKVAKVPVQKVVEAPPVAPTPPPLPLVNHFHILLDDSSSMEPLRNRAVDTLNANINAIRGGSIRSGQPATVSFTTFGADIRTRYFCEPVENLRKLDSSDYWPHGNTPLLDAVGLQVEKMLARKDSLDENVSFVFIIITDGEENASKEFHPTKLNELIARVQRTDRWSFAWLVPRGASKRLIQSYGIPDGNVREWDQTDRGMAEASLSVTAGVGAYYDTRSAGGRSIKGFFQTNMNAVSDRAVRAKLTNIINKVKIVDINTSIEIREFVEKVLKLPYSLGHAYYQLMKPEDVQHHKQVMLRSRKDGNIYGGQEARDVLGLPPNLDVKVRPGDHGDWDIFVQSTSVNRKLVPGTRLIYVP